MKKNLKRIKKLELYFYDKNAIKKIIDYNNKETYPPNLQGEINSQLRGEISNLRGDISNLQGYINSELRGYISGLWGYINSELRGNISGLWGEINSELRGYINSELRGEISGIRGNCANIIGNIDECELTEEERSKGVKIIDLII